MITQNSIEKHTQTHTCKNTQEKKEKLTISKNETPLRSYTIASLLKYCSLLNGNEPAKCSCQLSLT